MFVVGRDAELVSTFYDLVSRRLSVSREEGLCRAL